MQVVVAVLVSIEDLPEAIVPVLESLLVGLPERHLFIEQPRIVEHPRIERMLLRECDGMAMLHGDYALVVPHILGRQLLGRIGPVADVDAPRGRGTIDGGEEGTGQGQARDAKGHMTSGDDEFRLCNR